MAGTTTALFSQWILMCRRRRARSQRPSGGLPRRRCDGLNEEFKRHIKIQCGFPSAETAATLFQASLASGQITMRRIDSWKTLDQAPVKRSIDLAA